MHFVDDIYLVCAAHGSKLHAPDYLFAHVFHACAASGIEFVYIGVVA